MAKLISPLIIIVFSLIAVQFLFSNIKLLKYPAQDFEVFYLVGKQLLAHQNPYLLIGKDIVRNPPPALLLFAALPFLPILYAQAVWYVISFSAFIIGSVVLFKDLRMKGWRLWLIYLSLVLAFFPFRYNLGSGQVNNLLFLMLVLTFSLLQKRLTNLSALSFALAIILKITPFFLMVKFLRDRRFKLILLSLCWLSALIALSIFLLGPEAYRNYKLVAETFFNFNIPVYYNQSLAAFLTRLSIDPFLTGLIVLSLLAFFMLTLFLIQNSLILWNVSIIMMLIFAPFAWQYHFVIALFPLITTYSLLSQKKASGRLRTVLLFSYLLMAVNIKNPSFFGSLGPIRAIVLSHTLIGALMLLLLNLSLSKNVR